MIKDFMLLRLVNIYSKNTLRFSDFAYNVMLVTILRVNMLVTECWFPTLKSVTNI